MSHKYGRSPQWERINKTHVTSEAIADLTSFKSDEINYRIALWNPRTNGVRYLKTLIYNLAASLTSDHWSSLRRTRNRDVGSPIAVKCNGETICMDYLQAVLELKFLEKNMVLDGLGILEVGAGYGRTCHTIVSNSDVAAYYIVDLDNSLELARRYLHAVLDERQLGNVHFVAVDGLDDLLGETRLDLCLNINSFAEMNPETVLNYLATIDENCHYFYVKNPVAKYLDRDLDGHSQGSEAVALALSTGLLREVVDIHDSRAVEAQVPGFTAAYRPGPAWRCVANDWAVPWSYYWQALYRREG